MNNQRIVWWLCGALLGTPCLAAAQNPLQFPPRPNGPYEIRGVVVDAETGQPLPEVELSIQESAQPANPLFEVIQSESDGRFRFSNLAEGKYSVRASRQGYAEQEYLQHESFWSGIAVGPGKDSTHVRFPLSPSAAITGQVTDENGEPVRGANVTLWAEQIENGKEAITQAQNMQTDDEGRYRIGHLLPGKYSVSVHAMPWYSRYVFLRSSLNDASADRPSSKAYPTGWPVTTGASVSDGGETQTALPDVVYPTLYFPNARDWHEMEWVSLQAGDAGIADFHFSAEPSVHVDITSGREFPGMLLMSDLPGGGQGVLSFASGAPRPGIRSISGIAAGHYFLRSADRALEEEINATRDSQVEIDDRPVGHVSIAGTIRVDGGEAKIDQALLQLKDSQGRTYQGMYAQIPQGRAGKTGAFRFENLPSDTLELSILQPQDAVVKEIEAKGAKVSGTTIEIDGTQEVNLVVTVTQGSAVVEGTATRSGKPFAGAMILLVPEDGKETDQRVRRDQSDSDGTFRLGTVLSGNYLLMALEHGWQMEWSKTELLQPFLAKGTRVEIGKGQVSSVSVEVQ